ncbi:hypothetical protein LguiB_009824 [Lonicera macranthoides]
MALQRSISPAVVPHFFKFVQPQIVQDGRLLNQLENSRTDWFGSVPTDGRFGSGSRTRAPSQFGSGSGYEGNSHFHVLIFDVSASEIEYPSPKTIHQELTGLIGESQLKRKGVVDDDNVKSKKTRSNSTCKEQILERGGRDVLNGTRACRMKQVKSEEELHLFDFVKEVGDGASRPMPNTHKISHLNFPAECKQMASDAEKERALQLAKAFRSENPFFTCTMQPSYFRCHQLSFVDRYFSTKNKVVNVTLGVPDGRTWPVKYTSCTRKLSKGWRTFASGNHLEVGDVCIFELIKGFTNFLNVVIFRARKDANC